jgi:Mn2+/Fe2+ NRAMP family transporter
MEFSAGLVNGFHSGGRYFHRGAGVEFGAKLLIFGLGITFAIALGIMAMRSASDWTVRQYKRPEYSRAAGLGVFLFVVLVLGFAMARFL